MYLLYSLALSLLFFALLPYFVYQAARHGKYAGSFKQRMGWLPKSMRGDGRKTIWVHAVSVGEFLSARPLIDRLKSELPESCIVVSTTTLTGQVLARSQMYDGAFYFPFDWKFAVRRALRWVKPSIVIIIETEVWPNFLRECRMRGIATVLANGRISPRSFRRYKRVRSFMTRALQDFSLMIMQSEADADRARALGARAGSVRVCGNLKYDQTEGWGLGVGDDSSPQAPTPSPSQELDRRFALSSSPHLIVAGSTAPQEEDLLLGALAEVRNHTGLEGTRLVIAPRHPERFNEVANLIARSNFKFVRRSQATGQSATQSGATRAELPLGAVAAADQHVADVILLDTIGELASIYSFAAVVFVGGSLVPRGGHNIIEPAAFAKPIIVGPYTENFRQIISDFARRDAVVQVSAGEGGANSLARELIRLLCDHELACAMGERASQILLANRGATECTVRMIKEITSVED